MKVTHIFAAAALAVAAIPTAFAGPTLSGSAQAIIASTEPIRVVGVVANVDRSSNTMTVIGPQGNALLTPVAIGGTVQRLPVAGDDVLVEFRDALLATAQPAGADREGIRTRIDTQVAVPTPSGYSTASQIEVAATLTHVNRTTREVTLRGARQTVTVKAAPDVDLTQVKAGDWIHAVLVSTYSVELAHR